MRRKTTVLVGALAVLGPLALAFNIGGERWPGGGTLVHIGIAGESPSGGSYLAALREAAGQWNDTEFEFSLSEDYIDPCSGLTTNENENGIPLGAGDARNSVDFRKDVCGNAFGEDVLAITLTQGVGGTLGFSYINQADIIFNDNYDWDVYSGSTRSRVDFRRVALHELGHVLGLDHELSEPAIMAPRLGNIDLITDDDRAGVTALYGGSVACAINSIGLNRLVRDSLVDGDCRVQDLYNAGTDTSFVDTYSLVLERTTTLRLRMSSDELDSVLLVTDPSLTPIDNGIFDDTGDSCDAEAELTLAAGEYMLLANTFVRPEKCGGNTGTYTLSVSDTAQPLLREVRSSIGGEPAEALFTGGARTGGGAQYRERFGAAEAVTVEATIAPDPAHVGLSGDIYVVAVLSNGRQYMKLGRGQFVLYTGGFSNLRPLRSGTLQALESVNVVQGLRGTTTKLAGLDFDVYVGYSLAGQSEIHYGSPIRFTIDP